MPFKPATKEVGFVKCSMFGPKGNPSSHNMFGVIAELAKAEGVNFLLKAKPAHA